MFDTQETRKERELHKRLIRAVKLSLAVINGYTRLLQHAESETERKQYAQAIQTEGIQLVWAVNILREKLGLDIRPDDLSADGGSCE